MWVLMLRCLFVVLVAYLVLPTINIAYAASFDCLNALTNIEKMICGNEKLTRLDQIMTGKYKDAMSRIKQPNVLRAEQRKWLKNNREKCGSEFCLEFSYKARIEELKKLGWMTDKKADSICESVVNDLNSGVITSKFIGFEPATKEDMEKWEQRRPEYSGVYLQSVLEIDYGKDGVTEKLGILGGGGTCGNCDIVDLNAKNSAIYPADDSDEHLRWASWGNCDNFLYVNDEPIVLTGSFTGANHNGELVSWIDPDGAKRPLCYLKSDKKIKAYATYSRLAPLCESVADNEIVFKKWSEQKSPTKEFIKNVGLSRADAISFNDSLDINLDGKNDAIGLVEYSSGAGCGSHHQWLVALNPDNPQEVDSELHAVFNGNQWGPMNSSVHNGQWLSPKLFRFGVRPHLLVKSNKADAAVISVWENKIMTWCEFELFPQHEVSIYYRVETWPEIK